MNHHIIETYQDFLDLKTYVADSQFEHVFVDVETDSKIDRLAKLYGVGICFESHEGFYFPIRKKDTTKWWTPDQESEIANWVYKVCSIRKLVNHNIIYDVIVIQHNWGYDLTPFIYSDTILQKHALDEEKPFGLKDIAERYLGSWATKAQETLYANIRANGGKTTKENMEMYKADTAVLAEYCCYDVMLDCQLFHMFEKRIIEEGLYDLFYVDEIMPLYKEVTIPMKQRGFNIDVEYFKSLNFSITEEINLLEKNIQEEIKPLIDEYLSVQLNENYPVKKTGLFPKYYAQMIGFELPRTKEGIITLAKKELDKLVEPSSEDQKNYLGWLRGSGELSSKVIRQAQEHWHFVNNEEDKYLFNLKSNDDLIYLLVEKLEQEPLSRTETGKPQVDDDFLEKCKEFHPWVQKLLDFKRLMKLKGTYIEGILDRQVEGIIYSSFLQFGPPSGRYASRDPNLQNLPRLKEDDAGLSELVLKYVNSIKRGFVSPAGYKLVNADYSQLEPRAFAEACEDHLLQAVFKNKEDLYGSIARNIWSLDCTANEVKKKYPEHRQKAKVVALAVVYGAEAGRICQLMKIDYLDAQKIIDDYLNAYPGLKNYMSNCNREACTLGMVKTKYGRIRHLPEAKRLYETHGLKLLDKRWAKNNGLEEISWKFKSMLNLAKNYKIQGVAAHIVNRAMIATNRMFKSQGIEGIIVATVHDEICCVVREDQAQQGYDILQKCMEHTLTLSVPLVAVPIIATNWADAK